MSVPSRTSRLIAAPALSLLLGFAGGCATRSGGSAFGPGGGGGDGGGGVIIIEPDVVAVAPPDFQVDVLLLAGPLHAPADGDGERVTERPMRLTVSPDGSLHAALDRDVSGLTVPERIRTLNRPTMAELWTTARTLGLLDPDLDAPPVHPATVRPALDELVVVISIWADGEHRSIVDRSGGPQRLDPDLARFIRRLADLAWASDRRDDAVRVIPRRYDLGDDPYRRYRRPEAAGAGAGAG